MRDRNLFLKNRVWMYIRKKETVSLTQLVTVAVEKGFTEGQVVKAIHKLMDDGLVFCENGMYRNNQAGYERYVEDKRLESLKAFEGL